MIEVQHKIVKTPANAPEDDDDENIKPDWPERPAPAYGEYSKEKATSLEKEIDDAFNEQERRTAPPRLVTEFPRWLRVNLITANVTVGIMFVVAMVNLAFAGVMKDDLKDDIYDSTCEYNYIRNASEPTYENRYSLTAPGRYHDQCARLYMTSYVLLAAGSISMLRAIPVSFFPVQSPSRLSIHYRPDGWFDRMTTPARIYAMRTFFSMAALALYLFGIISWSTSLLITGPPAEDSYKQMYSVALGILGLSALLSLHQAMTTAYAGLYWKLWRQATSSPDRRQSWS